MGLLNQRLGIENADDKSSKSVINRGSLYSVADTNINTIERPKESTDNINNNLDNDDIIRKISSKKKIYIPIKN